MGQNTGLLANKTRRCHGNLPNSERFRRRDVRATLAPNVESLSGGPRIDIREQSAKGSCAAEAMAAMSKASRAAGVLRKRPRKIIETCENLNMVHVS